MLKKYPAKWNIPVTDMAGPACHPLLLILQVKPIIGNVKRRLDPPAGNISTDPQG